MRWSSWLGLLQSRSHHTPVRGPRQPAASRRKVWQLLFLEPLEDRMVPSVNWINTAGGDWSIATNWQDMETGAHRVPESADDVVISSLQSGAAVTHAAAASDSIN